MGKSLLRGSPHGNRRRGLSRSAGGGSERAQESSGELKPSSSLASELLRRDLRSCLSALRCLPSEQLSKTHPCPRWAVEETLSLAAEIPQPWCVRAVGPYGVMRGRRGKLTWFAPRLLGHRTFG